MTVFAKGKKGIGFFSVIQVSFVLGSIHFVALLGNIEANNHIDGEVLVKISNRVNRKSASNDISSFGSVRNTHWERLRWGESSVVLSTHHRNELCLLFAFQIVYLKILISVYRHTNSYSCSSLAYYVQPFSIWFHELAKNGLTSKSKYTHNLWVVRPLLSAR